VRVPGLSGDHEGPHRRREAGRQPLSRVGGEEPAHSRGQGHPFAMLDGGRCLYAGFQAQQSAEKALKAVIQEAVRVPPKVHDLEALAERAGLDDGALAARLKVLSAYYIATRYPQERAAPRKVTDHAKATELIHTAREVLAWATLRLSSTNS
jgi:HEPN domain-containing protein